jgi:hypothetical protein
MVESESFFIALRVRNRCRLVKFLQEGLSTTLKDNLVMAIGNLNEKVIMKVLVRCFLFLT